MLKNHNSAILPASRAGIYIHVPFCLRKCPYCDFYSVTDLSLKGAFLAALENEIQRIDAGELVFDSLFFGGGTPSLLETDEFERILHALHAHLNILPQAEISLEVNPGTVNAARLSEFVQLGVNRLNIGVQSFQDANLRFLGRIHRADEARRTLAWAADAGCAQIGLDLIYALPAQRRSDWLNDLQRAVDFQPSHLSCYMLTCEGGTPLDRQLRAGSYKPPAEVRARDLFETAIDFLSSKGYLHYEISNFARMPAHRGRPEICRHNLKYWTFAPYVGLGPAAHSFIDSRRFWNKKDLHAYIRDLTAGEAPVAQSETLNREQLMMESIYLGLRLTRGLNLKAFKDMFGVDFVKTFAEPLSRFIEQKMLLLSESHCSLSRQGLAFHESIAAALTDQIPFP